MHLLHDACSGLRQGKAEVGCNSEASIEAHSMHLCAPRAATHTPCRDTEAHTAHAFNTKVQSLLSSGALWDGNMAVLPCAETQGRVPCGQNFCSKSFSPCARARCGCGAAARSKRGAGAATPWALLLVWWRPGGFRGMRRLVCRRKQWEDVDRFTGAMAQHSATIRSVSSLPNRTC